MLTYYRLSRCHPEAKQVNYEQNRIVFLEPNVILKQEALLWNWQLSRFFCSTDRCSSLLKTKSHLFNKQPIQKTHTKKTAQTHCCGYKVNCITSIKHATDKKLHNRHNFKTANKVIFSIRIKVIYLPSYNTSLYNEIEVFSPFMLHRA